MILLPLLLMAAAGIERAPQPEPALVPLQVEQEALEQLLTVHRVYIDRLSGGETALQMRDMIAASLQSAVTEVGSTGRRLRWAASTGTRLSGVLSTVARSGQQQRYWGVAFEQVSP